MENILLTFFKEYTPYITLSVKLNYSDMIKTIFSVFKVKKQKTKMIAALKLE